MTHAQEKATVAIIIIYPGTVNDSMACVRRGLRLRSVRKMHWALPVFVCAVLGTSSSLLYPRDSESRDVKSLDGLWDFRADYSPGRNTGFVEDWYNLPLSQVDLRRVLPFVACI